MATAKKNKAVTAVDILRHARALLARRGGWTQGNYATDKAGEMTPHRCEDAVCFCADGALMRADFDLRAADESYGLAYSSLAQVMGNIVLFNDAQKTKRPVLRAFDKAIARLEAQG